VTDAESDATDHCADVDYTGDDAEDRLILCVPCRRYQPLQRDGQPECEHDISAAKDISHLDNLTWAYIRLHAYRRELERDEPRGSEGMLKAELSSLVADLVFADEDVPEPGEMADVIERRVES
jgi:hypothetical protein